MSIHQVNKGVNQEVNKGVNKGVNKVRSQTLNKVKAQKGHQSKVNHIHKKIVRIGSNKSPLIKTPSTKYSQFILGQGSRFTIEDKSSFPTVLFVSPKRMISI